MYCETFKSNIYRFFSNLRKLLLLCPRPYQASFSQRCGGDTVGWLRVFKAALLPWWLSSVARSHALPPSTRETWSQYLQAHTHTHVLTHTDEQEVQRRLDLMMCVVRLEVNTASLERRAAACWGPDHDGGDEERQVDRPTDTDWLSPLQAVHWQVGASVKKKHAAQVLLWGHLGPPAQCNLKKCLVCMCPFVGVGLFAYCQSGRVSVWRWIAGWCWAWRRELSCLSGSAGSASPPSPLCSRRNPADTLSGGLLENDEENTLLNTICYRNLSSRVTSRRRTVHAICGVKMKKEQLWTQQWGRLCIL